MRKLSFRMAELIFRVLVKLFIRLEIKGKENLPSTGSFILVSNHIHLIDPPLLILSLLPRRSRFMAKEELFRSWFYSPLMHLAEAFPVRRNGSYKDKQLALKQAMEVLKNGLILGMFPEGSRSRNGQLSQGYPGAAVIALRSGAPIVPAAIIGTEKLKGIGWLKRPKVTITFGRPFLLPKIKGESAQPKLKMLTDLIMKEIAILLPVEYRGKYREMVKNGD